MSVWPTRSCAEDDQTKGESRALLPSGFDVRDAIFPAHVRWTQVAKRHDMALSALRRTLDDTHDQVCEPASTYAIAVASMALPHAGRRRALGA